MSSAEGNHPSGIVMMLLLPRRVKVVVLKDRGYRNPRRGLIRAAAVLDIVGHTAGMSMEPARSRMTLWRRDAPWTGFVLPLVWVALVVGAGRLYLYAFGKLFTMAGARPLPAAQVAQGHAALHWLAIVLCVLPAAGLVLSLILHRSRHQIGFGIVLACVLLGTLGVSAARPHHEDPPLPVTNCIPISGGHGCPGG
jgi:hypothetical protein